MRAAFCIMSIALLLPSCAGRVPFGGDPGLQVSSASTLPPPLASDIVPTDTRFIIGGYDKISIRVFGAPDLSVEEVQTDATGRVSVPLIGSISAAGKSPDELAREIEGQLRGKYVRDPKVTVNLKDATGHTITVSGDVVEPGIYPVAGPMTLVRAIAVAKGPSEFARLDDVVVFRTVNGKKMAAIYNLTAISRGAYGDPELYTNDIVIVGDSPAARRLKAVLQVAPTLIAPLIYILR